MELPVELRLDILEITLRSELDFNLAIPLDASERADPIMQRNRRCFSLGIFQINAKIRVEAIPILLKHCQFIVKEQMTLENLQRWVAAGKTGLRLEDHVRHLWIRWHATIITQYVFTDFLKPCKKLESLKIELGGSKFYPWCVHKLCPCGNFPPFNNWLRLQWVATGCNPVGDSAFDHKDWSFSTHGWNYQRCDRLRQLSKYMPRTILEELRTLRGLQAVDMIGPAYWPSNFWQRRLAEWLREAMCKPKEVIASEPVESQPKEVLDVEMTDYYVNTPQLLAQED